MALSTWPSMAFLNTLNAHNFPHFSKSSDVQELSTTV